MRNANVNGAIAPTDINHPMEDGYEPDFSEYQTAIAAVRQEKQYRPELITKFSGILPEQMAELYQPFAISQYEQHPFHKFFYVKEEAINLRLSEFFGVDGWSLVVSNEGWVEPQPPVVKRSSDYIPLDWFIENELPPMMQIIGIDEDGTAHEAGIFPIQVARQKIKDNNTFPHYKLIEVDETRYEKVQRIKADNQLNIIHDVGYYWAEGYIEAAGQRRYTVGFSEVGNLGKEPSIRMGNTKKAAYTDLLKRAARMFGIGLELTEIDSNIKDLNALRAWLNSRYPNDPRYWDENRVKLHLVNQLQAAVPEYYKGEMKEIGALVVEARKVLDFPGDNWYIDHYFECRDALIAYARQQVG